MSRKLFFFLFLLLNFNLHAQDERYLSLELGGSGGVYSLNFERDFLQKEKHRFSWRGGGEIFPVDNRYQLVFPLLLNGYYGGGAHKLKYAFGQGVTIAFGKAYSFAPFSRTVLNLGWRYEPPGKKLFFEANYTPLISYLMALRYEYVGGWQYEHWGGFTIGYRLGPKTAKP